MNTRIMPDTRFDLPCEVIEYIRELHGDYMDKLRTREERKTWQDMQQRDLNMGGGWD